MAKAAVVARATSAERVARAAQPATVAKAALEFRPALIGFFKQRTRAPEECEDLAQEVFVRLLKYESSPEIRFLRGFVFQIANCVLVDWSRRTKARAALAHELEGHAGQDESLNCERRLLVQESLECVRKSLEELPERSQTVLIRRRLDGSKTAEIAGELGVSLSTVEKLLRQATTHLRSRLESL